MSSLPFNNNPDLRQSQHHRLHHPQPQSPGESLWRARNSQGLPGYGLQSQSGPGAGAISSKLNGIFGSGRVLPMYKDKPYFAPRRTGPRLRRRRALLFGVVIFFVIAGLWWYDVWGIAGDGKWRLFGSSKASEVDKGAELWKWLQSLKEGTDETIIQKKGGGITKTKAFADWNARREKVRDAFVVSWDGYEKYAWGFDEYHPIAKGGRHMVPGGMGWIIVDALDTLIIMNLTSQVQHARNWIHNSLQYNQNHDVSTFETTIRMLGGLLSAHYLSTTYPDLAAITDDDVGSPGEDLYLEKATDLAQRLLGAFDSNSGVPYASVNLNQSTGIPSHADGGASSTAEATTVQLEFKYLAKLTGEPEFWTVVEKVMQVVDRQTVEDGLVPIYIYPDTGKFKGNNIRLGSRGDSYYEYLIKQYLQTSKQEPIYKEMWDEALLGIRKHLITYTKNARLTVLAERPDGLHQRLSPKMDHLVCFMAGTIALGATGGLPLAEAKKSPEWSVRQDEEMLLAQELTKTCWATYLYTKTGLAPEITYFEIDDPPVMMADMFPDSTLSTASANDKLSQGAGLMPVSKPLDDYEEEDDNYNANADDSEAISPWRKDIKIHAQDRHNLQRPETVETLFYMYRITGDEMYRDWGWEMFKAFIEHTSVVEHEQQDHDYDDPASSTPAPAATAMAKPTARITGFTSLSNADVIPAIQRDNMESFWLAETLKYFYLLFSERDFLPLERTVFNTEAHPLPRFELGGELKTGWSRKS